MRRLASILLLVALIAGTGLLCRQIAAAGARGSLTSLFSDAGDFPLGAGTNRIDYQSLDAASHRLYIAKMGAGELVAFDVKKDRMLAELAGFPKATGVLVVPKIHRLYVSVPGAGPIASLRVALGMTGLSSGDGAVAVLDTNNLREIARLPGGVFPDGIAFDPKEQKIFVSDELGDAVFVIDTTNRLIARIALDGQVGNVRYDPVTGEVYVPVQSRNELGVIDPMTDRVVARYSLPGANHPHGLMLARDTAIAYIACDGNDRLLTVDLAAGKVLDRKPLGHDPDVMAIDPSAKRLYVAAESGNLSVFDIAVPTAPAPLGIVFVGKDAHSVAVDPITHRLYFPLADVKGRAVLRVLEPKL